MNYDDETIETKSRYKTKKFKIKIMKFRVECVGA